jgi:hypothetical protein
MDFNIDLVSQFLAVLVGIAIGLLGREIVTDINLQFLWGKRNIRNYYFGAPLVLSFIAMFALIEYWRVTSTVIPTNKSTQAWLLYIDLLFFLIAFISLRGYGNSISSYIKKITSQEEFTDAMKKEHSNELFRYTCFLGVFLFIGLVRYKLLTCVISKNDTSFEGVREQMLAHTMGIFLCIIACLFFWRDKIKYGFSCSVLGLVVVVVYFVFNNVIK